MTGPINTKDFNRVARFKENMASEITRIMPELRTVEVLPGRFNLDWLEQKSFRAPAAFPTVLKSRFQIKADRTLWLMAKCACFFVAEGREEKRDTAVWAMAEAFATILPNNMFGLTHISAPHDLEVDPLISAKVRSKGVSIVAVAWEQTLRTIGTGLFDDEGTLLRELYLNNDNEPNYVLEETAQ